MRRVELVPIREEKRSVAVLWDILVERSDPSEKNTNISHKELPLAADHIWFVQHHPFWRWYLIRNKKGKYVGQIRVTERNEIGIGILKKHRRKGYASAALDKLITTVTPQPYEASKRREGWVANINPKNPASIALFKKFGFRHIQNTYLREVDDES